MGKVRESTKSYKILVVNCNVAWKLLWGSSWCLPVSTQRWVLGKEVGWKGRERGKKRKITSPGFSVNTASGLSTVLGLMCSSFGGVCWFRWFFPHLELSFLLSIQMSYHAQSIYQDLSGTGSEGFGGLGLPWSLPYSPCPHLELIPPPELYCVVPISSFQKEEIYLRKGLPCLLSHMLSLVTSCHYWQSLAGSAALCLSVFGTHTSVPLPLRFLHPSSGDHCCETDFLGSSLHRDVGIPNAWAVFLGYVLNFASLALEMYATLTCWGYIQEEVQAGEGNKHARRNGESDTYFFAWLLV